MSLQVLRGLFCPFAGRPVPDLSMQNRNKITYTLPYCELFFQVSGKCNRFTEHFHITFHSLFFFIVENRSINHKSSLCGFLTSLPHLVRTVSVVGPSPLGDAVTGGAGSGGAGSGGAGSSPTGGSSASTTSLLVCSGTKCCRFLLSVP